MITLAGGSTWAPRRERGCTSIYVRASALGAVAFLGTVTSGPSIAVLTVAGVGAVAAAVDVRTGRIPNRLVILAAAVLAAGVVAASIEGGPVGAAVGSALGAVAFAGPLLVCHLVSPPSIGFGDVKLALVSGAALGLVDPRLGLAALCIAAGVTAAAGLLWRRTELPLGPGLVLGTVTALLIEWTWWS